MRRRDVSKAAPWLEAHIKELIKLQPVSSLTALMELGYGRRRLMRLSWGLYWNEQMWLRREMMRDTIQYRVCLGTNKALNVYLYKWLVIEIESLKALSVT